MFLIVILFSHPLEVLSIQYYVGNTKGIKEIFQGLNK